MEKKVYVLAYHCDEDCEIYFQHFKTLKEVQEKMREEWEDYGGEELEEEGCEVFIGDTSAIIRDDYTRIWSIDEVCFEE